MRTKQLLATLLMAILFAGCYKDDIDDLQGSMDNITNRLETVEQWMNETNTNIASLQTIITALEKKDYITEITALADSAGYEINFSQSGKITIYNGKNGTDGYTPEISIEKDKDGNYCWTLDGEFMIDADGKNISAMGLMPQLKIESDYWHISYDGKTWTKLGKAKGEDGEDGKDGSNGWGGATGPKGDSFFEDVEVTETSVTLTLSEAKGGAEFTLPIGAISFEKAGVHTIDLTETTATLDINIPESYQALTAKIEPKANDFAIMTKAGAETWKVGIAKGTTSNKAVVTITIDKDNTIDEALLTVTLVDSKGESHSIGKVIRISQLVMTANELIAAANEAKTAIEAGKSYNITLGADIDLSSSGNWTPIGTKDHPYTGTFDGNNKKITGLVIKEDRIGLGLIGYLGADGKVENLTLEDCTVHQTGTDKDKNIYTGSIVGYNYGKVYDCTVTGTVSVSGVSYSGGVVGVNYINAEIRNCTLSSVAGKEINISTKTGNRAAGISAYNQGGYITNCHVVNNEKGKITITSGSNNAGAVVATNAYISSGGTIYRAFISDCTVRNTGSRENLTIKAHHHAGGISSGNADSYIINCSIDNCTIIGTGQCVGGISTELTITSINIGCKATNCDVTGGSDCVGGIVGRMNKGTLIACYAGNMHLTTTSTDDTKKLGVAGIVGVNAYMAGAGNIISSYAYNCTTIEDNAKAAFEDKTNVVGVNFRAATETFDKNVTGPTSGVVTNCYYFANGASSTQVTDVNGTGDTVAAGIAANWASAVTAMNNAIDTWNAANGNACTYKWKIGTTYSTAELE